MEKLIKKVSILKEKGLFHIFGTSIINYIISFFTNIFIVRFMKKRNMEFLVMQIMT